MKKVYVVLAFMGNSADAIFATDNDLAAAELARRLTVLIEKDRRDLGAFMVKYKLKVPYDLQSYINGEIDIPIKFKSVSCGYATSE